MRAPVKFLTIVFAVAVSAVLLSSFLLTDTAVNRTDFTFPYRRAGLTDREAAAHLLSRFTYGATPGQIDAVTKMGLENWFGQQLEAKLADDSLNQKLATL